MAWKRPGGLLLVDLPLVLAGTAALASAWSRGSKSIGVIEWLILSGAATAYSLTAIRLAWRTRPTSHRVLGLRPRMAGPTLVATGILAVAVVGLADLLGFGTSPDFGRLQAPGVTAGCVIIIAGVALQVRPADLLESRAAGALLDPLGALAIASTGAIVFAVTWIADLGDPTPLLWGSIRVAGSAIGIILTAAGLAALSPSRRPRRRREG